MKSAEVEFVLTSEGVLVILTRADGTVDTQEMTLEEFRRLQGTLAFL